MDRVQLNIRLPVSLVAALKTEAQQQGITLTALVEQQLAGDSKPASSGLADQLAAVEQRLAALERGQAASPKRVKPAPQSAELVPPRVNALDGNPITTAELAELLNIRRGTLNARISRAGGPVVGLELSGWCCVALEVPSRGGPARSFWQAAT